MIWPLTLTAPGTERLLDKFSFLTYDMGIQHLETGRLVTFYLNISQSFLFGQNRKRSNLLNKPQAFTAIMGCGWKFELVQVLQRKSQAAHVRVLSYYIP